MAGYRYSEEDRARVRIMAATGVPHTEIASVLGPKGISINTLKKYYRRELDHAARLANASVANVLYSKAMAGDLGACCFWLKCRAGWKERHGIEHTGADGAPLLTLAHLDQLVKAAEEEV